MMNQRNLIIGVIVIVGAYFIYKKYYKPTTTPTKTPPIIKPPIQPTEPIRVVDGKGEPIAPTPISTSSFDSFDEGL